MCWHRTFQPWGKVLVGGEVDKSLPNMLSYPMEVDIENQYQYCNVSGSHSVQLLGRCSQSQTHVLTQDIVGGEATKSLPSMLPNPMEVDIENQYQNCNVSGSHSVQLLGRCNQSQTHVFTQDIPTTGKGLGGRGSCQTTHRYVGLSNGGRHCIWIPILQWIRKSFSPVVTKMQSVTKPCVDTGHTNHGERFWWAGKLPNHSYTCFLIQ
jgi:hypothetical protein